MAPLLLLGVTVVGCYSLAEPSLAPGDQRDVLAAMLRRGIVLDDLLPGRTACGDPDLEANALFMTARMPSDQEPRDVYVHIYRERAWEASVEEVDACQDAYASAHPGATVVRLDVPTYRVFGADWSAELTEGLRAALEEASQAGR
jgi:hypothetical protein